eukprot:CCRYP_008093-RC/>CCRYP_008093-RC protein AED:0.47 eAED:1.00 QI:0/0/0/1/0/0/2/0/158
MVFPTSSLEGGRSTSRVTPTRFNSSATSRKPSNVKVPCRSVGDMSAGLGGNPSSPSCGSMAGGGGRTYATRRGMECCTARDWAKRSAQLSTSMWGLEREWGGRGRGVEGVRSLVRVGSMAVLGKREEGACGGPGGEFDLGDFLDIFGLDGELLAVVED